MNLLKIALLLLVAVLVLTEAVQVLSPILLSVCIGICQKALCDTLSFPSDKLKSMTKTQR